MTLIEVERLTPAQQDELFELFQGEWWTRGRTRADVATLLWHSDVVVGLCEEDTGRLAAFARVLHDGARKAFLLDVIVAPAWRRRGIGQQLVDAVAARPELAGVAHIDLHCRPELVPFYERFGFTAFPEDLLGMRLERSRV